MLFTIQDINRTVELNDELVNAYKEIDEFTQDIFILGIYSKYHYYPTKEQMSDEQLSKVCNKILLEDLQMYIELPKVLNCIDKNAKVFTESVENIEMMVN